MLILASFTLVFLFTRVLAEFSMMLVYGQPVDMSNCTTSSSSTFESCYDACYNKVAYMNMSDPMCTLCDFDEVSTIKKTLNVDKLQVAVKMDITSGCPTSVTNEGQVIPGANITNEVASGSCQIVYADASWQLQCNVTKYCPTRWQRFERQAGSWCIKYFYNSYYNSTYNYNSWYMAQELCGKQNSVLTGIESTDELNYITNSYSAIQPNLTCSYNWLGGKRTSNCILTNWNATVCNNRTIFEWTDNFTTGTDGFEWGIGYPHGDIDPGTTQNYTCLLLLIANGLNNNRSMVDTGCTRVNVANGFACGKQPGV